MTKEEEEIKNYKILEVSSVDDDIYDPQKRIPCWDQRKVSNTTINIIGAGRKRKNDNLRIVGWWHSHPNFGCFLNPTDLDTQIAYAIIKSL